GNLSADRGGPVHPLASPQTCESGTTVPRTVIPLSPTHLAEEGRTPASLSFGHEGCPLQRDTPSLDAFRRHAADVPDESENLEEADQPPAGVELVPFDPEARRGREGMVIIVPTLAPREDTEDCTIVAVIVAHLERSRADQVQRRIERRHQLF